MPGRDRAGTVTLEGELDEFGLPAVLRLLGEAGKSGTLHLRRGGAHGVLHLSGGRLTGGRADAHRQALARRLVGSGLVDDATLESVAGHPAGAAGLPRLLVERVGIDAATAARLAGEQVTDAVYDLMGWSDGSFAFVPGQVDPDDVGARLPVDEVVDEAGRRHEAREQLAAALPRSAVVSLAPAPAAPPRLSVADWQLLSLAGGGPTVGEVIALSGLGEFAVSSALAALVAQGLLRVGPAPASAALQRRQELLARLEGRADEPPLPVPPLPVTAYPGVDMVLLLRLIAGVRGL